MMEHVAIFRVDKGIVEMLRYRTATKKRHKGQWVLFVLEGIIIVNHSSSVRVGFADAVDIAWSMPGSHNIVP